MHNAQGELDSIVSNTLHLSTCRKGNVIQSNALGPGNRMQMKTEKAYLIYYMYTQTSLTVANISTKWAMFLKIML